MNDGVPHLFVQATLLLEDLHGVCVEGQRADQCRDLQRVLLSSLRTGVTSLDALVIEIAKRLR